MSSAWGVSWGNAWGDSWGSRVALVRLPVGKAQGGGGSIFYQVPRRKLSLLQRPNDHLEAVLSAGEFQTLYQVLTDPERASPRMVAEVTELLAPYATDGEVDFVAAAEDGNLGRSVQAIWRRYSEKRKELRREMRGAGEDPDEYE